MKVQTSYLYFEDRNEWLGVVFVGRTILTAGCMATEADIQAWLAEVVRTRAWITGTEPPDLYDTRH